MLLFWAVACSGKSGDMDDTAGDTEVDTDTDTDTDIDADSDSDTDADTDTDTTPIEVPADNVVNALGDCLGYFREPDEYPNQLIPGEEMQRYTLGDPEAVCNDGTRAVMYVRAWTNEALKDVWEIHLQGGGGCQNWQDCAVRWCGTGYYEASKMSSTWAPEEVGAVGIMDENASNLLSGANHAYFYYCSSDSWSGQGSQSLTAPEATDTGDTGMDIPEALPDFSMFKRGHTIVASGIDELEAGVVGDGGEVMPALSDAAIVLLNGTSAGSSGARHNADWLTERLAGNGTAVYAVFDAAISPATEYWPADLQDDVDARLQLGWENLTATSDVTPFLDESCVAAYPADELWKCNNLTYVMLNHITTPFFVRQDLRDLGDMAENLEIPEDDHEQAVVDTLGAVKDIQTNGVEGGSVTRVPGVYGPNCAQHVGMETNDWWRVATVEDDAGTLYTFQDAVQAWWQGNDVTLVDEPVIGAGDGPRSDCASVDEEH